MRDYLLDKTELCYTNMLALDESYVHFEIRSMVSAAIDLQPAHMYCITKTHRLRHSTIRFPA